MPAWRLATDIEKDTAALGSESGKDIVPGMVNASFVYVKEDGSWRRGTELDRDLENVCSKTNIRATDSMTVKHALTWFICDVNDDVLGAEIVPTVWREATIAEADTAGFGIPETKKDSVKIGNVNKSYYYVFEGDKWRFGTEMDYAIGPCTASKVGIVDTTSKGKWYKCPRGKCQHVRIPLLTLVLFLSAFS